jgi:transposase
VCKQQLDSADRQEPSEAISIKTTRIKEKIARLKQEMSRLEVLDAQMRNTPDQQISLTDPDARPVSLATTRSNPIPWRAPWEDQSAASDFPR